MTEDERRPAFDPSSARDVLADLAATVLLAFLAGIATLAPVVSETPIRFVLGIPLLVFLPGYALVAALFPRVETPWPEADTESTADADSAANGVGHVGGRIGVPERIALSIGSSVAVVSLVGYFLTFTRWEIRLAPVVTGVCLFTATAAGVAAVRRLRTPVSVRFAVPFADWWDRTRSLAAPDSRTDALLNAAVALTLVLALGSVAYAMSSPSQDSFSQFYVLSDDESGQPAPEGYPQNLTVGQNESLYVGIDNYEGRRVDYTVVVLLQRVGNESAGVTETDRLGQFRVSVGANQSKLSEHTFRPTMAGDDLRLTYLLYKEPPPPNPTRANAYRAVYFPVNASQ